MRHLSMVTFFLVLASCNHGPANTTTDTSRIGDQAIGSWIMLAHDANHNDAPFLERMEEFSVLRIFDSNAIHGMRYFRRDTLGNLQESRASHVALILLTSDSDPMRFLSSDALSGTRLISDTSGFAHILIVKGSTRWGDDFFAFLRNDTLLVAEWSEGENYILRMYSRE